VAVHSFIACIPDRHRHSFQFLDIEKGGESGEKGFIERKEAVRHILGIIRKMGVRWQRTPKPLPGWKDSL
jgi:hypothetical protein